MNKDRDKEKKRKKKRNRFNQVITYSPFMDRPFPENLRSVMLKAWTDRLLIRSKSDVSVRPKGPWIPGKTFHKKIKAIFVIMHPTTKNRALGNCSRIHYFNVLYWNCLTAGKWMESQMGKFRTVLKFRLLIGWSIVRLIGHIWKLE